MRIRYLINLFLAILLCGCTAGVDVESMIRDFDGYDKDLQVVATDDKALETLKTGREKRAEAATLVDKGKKTAAIPIVEEALADAHLALEMDRMGASARRAEKCLLEVEQARTSWREAVFVLEQTEEFVGKKGNVSKSDPQMMEEVKPLPASTLEPDSFPPGTIDGVADQWTMWRRAASERRIAAADLEGTYRHNYNLALAPKVDEFSSSHYRYVAARAVQALECRVRAEMSERVCVEATQHTAAFGDARSDVLRATLDLERGLQDDLRRDLAQLRAEAKTRQDELYAALSQMEGKFASIHRDARGTIVSLADILFDFDKATLRRDVEFNLVKIATILNQFGEMGILIEGHTDSIGTEEYNLGLSKRRAQAVFQFLISQDVNESRLSWEGYGEGRPVADNESEEGRQRNRRVDLVIQDAP
jgi:outer membrane protein OmpA-like peptidoglycan-associated protein